MPSRRAFLAAAAALAARPGWALAGSPAYLAAAREADGAYALFGLSADGADLFRVTLPERGHAAAAHPFAPEAVAFARRPGRSALVLDCAEGRVLARLEPPPGRHFYGHGAFVANGAILCTTENEIDSGEGRIGLWSRGEGWRRMGEIASGGIGPHELRALPDDTLVVANGGLRTHPDLGREVLNRDMMRSVLSYVSISGGVLEQVELRPELRANSIRHLAVAPDGTVAFAMQWQGDPADAPPLLGLHRRGAAPRLCAPDLAERLAMKGYAGSVAFDGQGRRVAITSPKGGRVQLFDAEGLFLRSHRRADICGLAPAPHGFLASDGLGALSALDAGLRPLGVAAGRAWDNHLIAL